MEDIDPYTHSTCSDGTLTPRQVVGLAKSIGLRAVAAACREEYDGNILVAEDLMRLRIPRAVATV